VSTLSSHQQGRLADKIRLQDRVTVRAWGGLIFLKPPKADKMMPGQVGVVHLPWRCCVIDVPIRKHTLSTS
jgi:hypothetical protein